MLVDSHCHLEMPEFDSDRDAVIERASAGGILFMLSIGDGSDVRAMEASLEMARRSPARIATSVGIHPHQAKLYTMALRSRLIGLAEHPEVVAWGEVGLDYHYELSPPEQQRTAFEDQARLAVERGLPLVVHCREAEEDTFSILSSVCTRGGMHGVMHCYTGNADFAARMVDLGFVVSFSGIVTFPKAEQIREAAARVPADMILVETDSPYLAPVPHRGKRNEPFFLISTADAVARVRGITIERLAGLTTENFFRLFSRIPRPPEEAAA